MPSCLDRLVFGSLWIPPSLQPGLTRQYRVRAKYPFSAVDTGPAEQGQTPETRAVPTLHLRTAAVQYAEGPGLGCVAGKKT